MREYLDLIEPPLVETSQGRTLYHGTLLRYVPSILENGLEPTLGEFTQRAYDEYISVGIDLPELVFAADRTRLYACASAILGALDTLGLRTADEAAFFANAALLVIKGQETEFSHRPRFEDQPEDIHPGQVEPGDFYADRRIEVTAVLTGKKLQQFFARNGVTMHNLMDEDGKSTDYFRDRILKIAIKRGLAVTKQEKLALLAKIKGTKGHRLYKLLQAVQGENFHETLNAVLTEEERKPVVAEEHDWDEMLALLETPEPPVEEPAPDNLDDILDEVTEIVSGVDYPIKGVWLYGSRAKGTARPDSDYDILVVADIFDDEVEHLQDELHSKVAGRDEHIEFLVCTPYDVDDPTTVAHVASKEGRRLFENGRPRKRRMLAESRAPQEYLSGYFYHGSAREGREFAPDLPAYFTQDPNVGLEFALMDSEVEGGTPVLFKVKLRCTTPAVLPTRLMQDLWQTEEGRQTAAKLAAQGYDCALADEDGHDEIAVLGNSKIDIVEVITVAEWEGDRLRRTPEALALITKWPIFRQGRWADADPLAEALDVFSAFDPSPPLEDFLEAADSVVEDLDNFESPHEENTLGYALDVLDAFAEAAPLDPRTFEPQEPSEALRAVVLNNHASVSFNGLRGELVGMIERLGADWSYIDAIMGGDV